MKREWRYWMWNAEELTGVLAGISIGLSVLFCLMEGSLENVWMCGVFLLVCMGFWIVSNSAQAGKLLSVSLMFGSTRRRSFWGMQLMMVAVLVQVEALQLVLWMLPVVDRKIQGLVVCYTPVVFLLMAGAGYFLSVLESRLEKAYKVVFGVFMGIAGGVVGFTGSMLVGEGRPGAGTADRAWELLGGTTMLIAAIAAAVIFVLGCGCYRRLSRNMDVTI